MDTINVTLTSDWGSLEEGFEFAIDECELITSDDIISHNFNINDLIEVCYRDDEYFIWESSMAELDPEYKQC